MNVQEKIRAAQKASVCPAQPRQREIEEENVSKQFVTGVSICVFPTRQRAIALPVFCAADCPLFREAGAIARR